MNLTEYNVDSAEAFVGEATGFIADVIRTAIKENGKAIVGLSGGNTPRPIYEALGQEKGIDWSKVWIFLVDDRCVPKDHRKSNNCLLRMTLLRYAPIPESQVIAPDTTLAPGEAARVFGQQMLALTKRHQPDLIVMGMGDDGHIASLFPPLSDLAFSDDGAVHMKTPLKDNGEPKFDIINRVSLTMPVLTKAKQALFLLQGKDKKQVWDDMIERDDDEKRWPAKAVIAAMDTTVITQR